MQAGLLAQRAAFASYALRFVRRQIRETSVTAAYDLGERLRHDVLTPMPTTSLSYFYEPAGGPATTTR